jgi:predicted MFS family arabinose efflux permease
VFKRNEAARQMSTISRVVAIAPAMSLAFGGIVAETAGWKGVMAVLAFSGVVCIYFRIPSSQRNEF